MENFENQSMQESKKKKQKSKFEQASESIWKKIKTKQFWLWLSPLIFAVGVMIAVTIAVKVAVEYFQLLFLTIADEQQSRLYISQFYTMDMALLYLSIIGFTIVLLNSSIYIGSFLRDKTKVTYFHGIFFVVFLSVGIALFVKKKAYKQYMESLTTLDINSDACAMIINDCTVSTNFISYLKSIMSFFIAFCVLYVIYAILFHLNSKWEVEEFLKPEQIKKNPSNIFQSQVNNMQITSQQFN